MEAASRRGGGCETIAAFVTRERPAWKSRPGGGEMDGDGQGWSEMR